MLFKGLFSVLFLLATINVLSQNDCDCPKAQELRAPFGRNFDAGNFDSALVYVAKVKDGKENICDAFYNNWMSQIYILKNDYDKARVFLNEEFKILSKINCSERLARHYTNYSHFYNSINKHDSSIYVLVKSLELLEKANDKEEQIRVCLNIGAIFEELKQSEKATPYIHKAVSIARQFKDTVSLAMSLTSLASSYVDRAVYSKKYNLLDSAYLAANEGLKYAWAKLNIYYILEAYNSIGNLFYYKKDLSKSIAYSDSIISICPREPSFFNRYLQLAFTIKSNCLFEMKQYQVSRQMADSALQFAIKFNAQTTIEPLELIYKTSKELGDFGRALWAHEQIQQTNDSLFTLSKNSAIAELEGKYNQEKNERKIENLDLQRKGYILISISILLLAALIVIYLRQQNLKHKQSVLEAEQRLNRSRINPHFFFNVLSSLQFLAAKEDDKKKLVMHFFSFSRLMRQTLESSYNDYVSITEEVEFIMDYLNLQELKRTSLFTSHIAIGEGLDQDKIKLPAMILQPFVENAIEHGFKEMETGGKIEILFSERNQELLIEIKDNGKGISETKTESDHVSRATQITRDRLFLINRSKKTKARFTINAKVDGKGTVVQIFLPLIK